MTIVQGFHGRARMRHAALARLWLLALLLVVPIGLRALETDVQYFVGAATYHATFGVADLRVFALEYFISCAGYAVAGIVFDRFGLKRAIALAILIWCAITALGATIVDPLAYRVLSPLFTVMLPGFAIVGLLLAVRLAWPSRRRGIVITILLGLYYHAYRQGLLYTYFPRPKLEFPDTWQFPIMALSTLGVGLFAVWLLGLREADRTNGIDLRPPPPQPDAWRQIMSDPAVWVLIAIALCQGFILSLSFSLKWELSDLLGARTTDIALGWAPVGAALVATGMSDWLYRRRRDWVAARRPLLVGGFIVAGIAPVLGALSTQSGPALHIIDLLAIGSFRVGELLALDCAPRQFAGRYIGFIVAGEAVGLHYLRPPVDMIAGKLNSVIPLIVLFAILGATLAWRLLPRLRPVEP